MVVLAVEPMGDRVFVGGRFTQVENGPGGARSSQRFLAAFDQKTGNWIDSFRPVLDGRVWDMVPTPDGKLIIAGDFTNVNGVPSTGGLAALDPVTGQVVPTWKVNVTREDSTGLRGVVRSVDIQDGFLYAGGRFNRVQGGTWNKISVGNAVKVNLTSGNPVGTWKPAINSTVVDLDATPDRVWFAGYFNNIGGDTANGFAGELTP